MKNLFSYFLITLFILSANVEIASAGNIPTPVPVVLGGTGVTTSTGTGNTVLSTSPTLVTPALGTPASGVATNLTGLPLSTGVTGILPAANFPTNSTAAQAALANLEGQPPYYVTNYGATCNGVQLSDITTASSSAVIYSTSYTFTAADVGKNISIWSGTSNTVTSTETSGSYNLTSMSSTTGIVMGDSVSGTGIPAGTIVTGIIGTTSLAISNIPTSTGAKSLVFTHVLNSTISSVQSGSGAGSTQATMANNSSTSISGVAIATFGTDDSTAINNAIGAAYTAGGGLVTLPKGICVVASSLIGTATAGTGVNEVSITGQGAGIGQSTIYWSSTSDMTSGVINFTHAVTCTIADSLLHQDNHFSNFKIDASSATDSSFQVQAKGIQASCARRQMVDHVHILNTPATCLATDFGFPTTDTNNILENCGRLVAGNPGGNGIGDAVQGLTGEGYVLSNNTVINPAHYGIFLESEAGTATEPVSASVTGNIVFEGYNSQAPTLGSNQPSSGIGNSGALGMTIVGNTVYGNNNGQNWTCINVDSGTVASNNSGSRTNITGNTCLNGVGIFVDYASAVPSTGKANLLINSNLVIGGGDIEVIPHSSGATMDAVQINNNQVIGATSAGILFAGSGAGTHFQINNNLLANNGTSLSTYRAAGIAFAFNVTGLEMTGNYAYDNGTSTQLYAVGVNTGVTLSGADIHGNNFSGNATSAFLNNGTITGSILNNYGIDLGTTFTTSGCSISATSGTSTSGTFTLGANSCTAVITPNGATGTSSLYTGWVCSAWDETAATILIGGNTSSTATTASFTIPAGAGSTDVIGFSCQHY